MNKKKILLYIVVFMFFASLTLFSSTFAKYVSKVEVGGTVEVGNLYAGYKTGDLFRNDILIMGVPFIEDGHTVIETKDIKPLDVITYYFDVTNIDYKTLGDGSVSINKFNNVEATYNIKVEAKMYLPAYNGGTIINIDCQIGRLVDEETWFFAAVDTSQKFTLPCYNPNEDGSLNTASVYSEKYQIKVDDTKQLTNLTSKHYFGATLNIYITVTAEQNIPIIS